MNTTERDGAPEVSAKYAVIVLRPLPWSDDHAANPPLAWIVELWGSDGPRAECECPNRIAHIRTTWAQPARDIDDRLVEAWQHAESIGLSVWRVAMRAPTDELGHVHGCVGQSCQCKGGES